MSEASTDIVTTNGQSNSVATAREKVAGMDAGVATIFSTIKGDTLSAKMDLFTALTNAERVDDHLDEVINLKHVVAQVVEVTQEDGSMTDSVRVILIGEDGTAYASVSSGLFKALENLLQVLGTPDTWGNAAIPIKIVAEKSRKGFRFFTVKMA